MLAYIPPGKEYILGRIHEQTVRTTTEDGKNVTKRTTYPSWLYDMPQAKREYLGQETRYDCQYDKQGNLIKSTTGWSGGAESISESWEYDTYGRKTKNTLPKQARQNSMPMTCKEGSQPIPTAVETSRHTVTMNSERRKL